VSESAEPSVEELVAQIRAIKVGQFLLSTGATLASLAFGKLDQGELDDARLAIDAMAAIVPLTEGQVEPEAKRSLEQAVANLKLAYAERASGASSEPTE